jgi:hypothetical protein
LIKAAKAAKTLDEAVWSLNQQDREWVDHILTSRRQREAGKIRDLRATISNLSIVFSSAIGRPYPHPRGTPAYRLARGLKDERPRIKDERFQELVYSLLRAADGASGKFTFNKNSQTGTLVDALQTLRPHLPKGLVPNALPFGTIQKLKTDIFQNPPLDFGISLGYLYPYA